jgi:hypothetical protein
MASRGKKKTTMAKLARENKLRERQVDKQAKKDARKRALAEPPEETGEPLLDVDGNEVWPEDEQPALVAAAQAAPDA